ncbi:MAG: phosphopentomutase [Clostridia bacterium]
MITLLIIDGFGIGECCDSDIYGDVGSNTYKSVCEVGVHLPNLDSFGLSAIAGNPAQKIVASYGKMRELSCGKDTTTGHFELVGLVTKKPYPVYPNGFPAEVVAKLEGIFKHKILANKPASGTQIIEEFGAEHLKTACPIVYTSQDSVLQIATHTSIYPKETLYNLCKQTRDIMVGEHRVARVIARPFTTENNKFVRTADRKDFGLTPEAPTVLNALQNAGVEVVSVGKIFDIFSGYGISRHAQNTHSNIEVLEGTLANIGKPNSFVFANLVETDMLYGHRNDVLGYKKCLEAIDAFIPKLIAKMQNGDVLIVTADHGCDPKTPSTDHSREFVPLMIFTKTAEETQKNAKSKTVANAELETLEKNNKKEKSYNYEASPIQNGATSATQNTPFSTQNLGAIEGFSFVADYIKKYYKI